MDLLVTTPKSEIDNSKKEGEAVEEEGGYWFRTFRFRPKTELGDKIYFVEDGLIKGYGIVIKVIPSTESLKCDVTGREWGQKKGWAVLYGNWHWLKIPVPFKGFQGIRYIDRIPGLKTNLKK